MQNSVLMTTLSINDLKEMVIDCVSSCLKYQAKEPQPTDKSDTYIDQKRVAELLDVSSVSVWEYERKGLLKSYRIGSLKRFLLSEVMASPKLIQRTTKK